jgi:hypothetical protein
MSRNILMISDTMIKEKTAIHGNIDPKLLYPEIKVAQDLYIHPLLGTALFDKILDDINAETLAGVYKTLVDDYLVDALIYYTLGELPTTISYQFWNKGVLRKQGDNTELPSMNELIDIANKYKNRAESYATRAMRYLEQNYSLFAEYVSPGSGVDTIYPTGRAFDLPVSLDLEPERKISYEEKYQGNNPRC